MHDVHVMSLRCRNELLDILRSAEKPLLFSEIVQRADLHPATVARLCFELAMEHVVEIERIGVARRVRLVQIPEGAPAGALTSENFVR
jgi:hypothetical protein